jgi:molecular chaperone GrpE
MSDKDVTPDPTKTSSFENAAIDPAAAAASGNPADVSGSTDELESDNEEVGIVTSALEREVTEQREKYLRLYAEFENFRRRAVRERQEAEHKGMQNLLRGMLETIDDIARFAHVDIATTDAKTLAEGVLMIEKKMLKSLAGHGLEVVDPKGQPFDPKLHEAITTTPAASAEEDHLVAQVYQVGYVHNGTLLRPARVVVTQWNG